MLERVHKPRQPPGFFLLAAAPTSAGCPNRADSVTRVQENRSLVVDELILLHFLAALALRLSDSKANFRETSVWAAQNIAVSTEGGEIFGGTETQF